MNYHLTKTIHTTSMALVKEKVQALLAEHGFGIVTTLDISEKINSKLNIAYRPYLVLGVCNPQFAFQALEIEPYMGALLPCTLVLQENINNSVTVSFLNPALFSTITGNVSLSLLTHEVFLIMQTVLNAL
ncbi:MAG: DUF302 domain-containing protein [Bacteroidales bacterium]|nr:DUF302 domain-containing protein [Bacteroidales bacterium]